ncbi:MAG: hypothetical protein WBG44_12605 [Comamonas sp.]
MIASNYRKHPEAMALQLVLQFGRALIWHTARPTQRILRRIRGERSASAKAHARVVYPTKKSVPEWARAMSERAKNLAKSIKAACMPLFHAAKESTPTGERDTRRMPLDIQQRGKHQVNA